MFLLLTTRPIIIFAEYRFISILYAILITDTVIILLYLYLLIQVVFLQYIEVTTAEFAASANNRLIKDIQKKVEAVKDSKEMEVEYMTLFQRDRENRELGREEGREEGYESSTKILKLYNKGIDKKEISSELNLDLALVEKIIRNYESI